MAARHLWLCAGVLAAPLALGEEDLPDDMPAMVRQQAAEGLDFEEPAPEPQIAEPGTGGSGDPDDADGDADDEGEPIENPQDSRRNPSLVPDVGETRGP